jgi:hypothetical protein
MAFLLSDGRIITGENSFYYSIFALFLIHEKDPGEEFFLEKGTFLKGQRSSSGKDRGVFLHFFTIKHIDLLLDQGMSRC